LDYEIGLEPELTCGSYTHSTMARSTPVLVDALIKDEFWGRTVRLMPCSIYKVGSPPCESWTTI
jgi:hypothetical protein